MVWRKEPSESLRLYKPNTNSESAKLSFPRATEQRASENRPRARWDYVWKLLLVLVCLRRGEREQKALLWRLGGCLVLHRKENYFVDRTFDHSNSVVGGGSSDIEETSLQFKQASISAKSVQSSSNVYLRVAVDLYERVLKLFNPTSPRTPGEMTRHTSPWWLQVSVTDSRTARVKSRESNVVAPTNVFPLSEWTR